MPAPSSPCPESLVMDVANDGKAGQPDVQAPALVAADAASVHSMPVVAAPALDQPRSPVPSSLSSRPPSAAAVTPPTRATTTQDDPASLAQQQRRARHRSAIEPRASNRLSGFFNNLIHRREPHHPSSREPIHEDSPAQPDQPLTNSEAASRASSPIPQRPASPPPPPLPPPTLHELGLSLSAMTTELAPSHFSTPPFSGAFLAPHYLLLCHAQGLDVLPLTSPPAAQPYALVRRVSFKSVVVMEHRGVLVAIAGRRDGVRVYALEEVKKAIEWRIEVELKRERDRTRRENTRKPTLRPLDLLDSRDSAEKLRKASLSTPPPGDAEKIRANILRKSSLSSLPIPPSPPPVPLVPRSATPRTPRKRAATPPVQIPSIPIPPIPSDPPPYVGPAESSVSSLHRRPSFVSVRTRGGSVSEVLAAAPGHHHRTADPQRAEGEDSKADWAESSDEEAIDVVAAGSSGSHLDERTSATLSPNLAVTSPQLSPIVPTLPLPPISRTVTSTTVTRRNRPSNLDLTLARTQTIPPPEPSPAPTLITLRQALTQPPSSTTDGQDVVNPETPFVEGDDDEEEIDGHISLAQALLESRIPDLPPIGTRRAQEPIIITPSNSLTSRPASEEPRMTEEAASIARNTSSAGNRRRRRWSIMISSPSSESNRQDNSPTPSTAPATRITNRFTRSSSFRSNISQATTMRSAMEPISAGPTITSVVTAGAASVPDLPITSAVTPTSSRASRFIPRIISNALHRRKSSERLPVTPISPVDPSESNRWTPHQSPPPKLEYVKLPGTKGALLVKAVETAKKSFLAILCGENGEKVELFAGTYRTALGLSRTFILPDSPRSLELQLQGDDLVEVFLVFAQNVFGLEPATVRVREVRIGRAERRAARRRARENRPGEQSTNDAEPLEEETNVNVSIGVSVPSTAPPASGDAPTRSASPTLVANEHPSVSGERTQTPEPANTTTSTPNTQAEELLLLATAQMGPYTTFQQLHFAPNFPLAAIADEYIIPPTYPTFLEHKAKHVSSNDGSTLRNIDLAQTQFSPPGLPVPTPTTPSKWYYRDPRNVVHGPWKSALMQAWYKDGLLPPDLPVRREEDTEYMLLKELRLQSVDPTQPFRVVAPLVESPQAGPSTLAENVTQEEMALLSPISLLEQPKHFGPPALFFSTRGGHSTSIVDVRGRSVLKGRFLWSNEDADSSKPSLTGKLGDVKRLEAFDVEKGAVLVAMRQGGLEFVNLGDALLKPADQSRTVLPNYNPPLSNINRRAPFIWKIGTPLTSTMTTGLTTGLDYKASGSYGLSVSKKVSLISTKNSNSRTDTFSPDFDVDPQDEVLFLGRKDDEVYLCERNAVSFRILRLSPTTHDTA